MNLRKQYVTVVTYMIKLHLLLQSPEFHEHFGERRCTVPRTVSELWRVQNFCCIPMILILPTCNENGVNRFKSV